MNTLDEQHQLFTGNKGLHHDERELDARILSPEGQVVGHSAEPAFGIGDMTYVEESVEAFQRQVGDSRSALLTVGGQREVSPWTLY